MTPDNELPVWTIRPNWVNGILERLEWLTDVPAGTYGTEQRRALRLSPRRTFEMTFHPVDAVRSYFDLWLHRLGSQEFMVPLWHDKGKLSSAVTIGATTIEVDTTYREFIDAGMAIIVGTDPHVYDVIEIDTVAADQITAIAGTTRAWPKGSAIYPLRRSRISQESLLSALTNRVGQASLEFQLNQANDIADEGAWADFYEGVPIILAAPNRRDQIDSTFIRNSLMLDNDHGLRSLLDDASRAFTVQTHSKMFRGRAEHWAFRQMVYRLRGMAYPVWLPTFNRDLELSRARLAADALIDIKKIGYSYTGGAVSGRRHILINGEIGREITGTGSAPSTDEERLTLAGALGSNLPAGTFASFMDICRLSQDTVEINHHTDTDGTGECSLSFRAYRDERVTDGPLNDPIPGTPSRSAGCGQLFEQIINIDSQANAAATAAEALPKGITISGFDPANVLKLTMPAGQIYTGWSPWGRPSPAQCSVIPKSGSINRFWIIPDNNPALAVEFGDGVCYNGLAAPRAGWTEQFITGYSSYTFCIIDTPITDNTGGLSILVELV